MLLGTHSAHLRIFRFLKEFALLHYNIFAWFKTMWKQQILARAIRIQKRELGVTTHFSEIIELKFGKKLPHILCILMFFENYGCLITSEKCLVTHIFLFGFQLPLLRTIFFLHSHNLCKNTSVLGGTAL